MIRFVATLLFCLCLAVPLRAQETGDAGIVVEKGRTPEQYYNIANWYSERGQHFRAIAYYQAAIAGKPRFTEAYINLGSSLRLVKRADEAVAAYRSALAIGNTPTFVHLNLGNALVDAGKLREAVAAFEQYIRLEPYEVDGYANLGIVRYQLKEYLSAAAEFEKLLLLKKDDSWFLYQAARCYALGKRYDKALEKARLALRAEANLKFVIMDEADFKEFRKSPEFRQLLAEFGEK